MESSLPIQKITEVVAAQVFPELLANHLLKVHTGKIYCPYMPSTTPPLCRIIREGTLGRCETCGSTVRYKYNFLGIEFGGVVGCIQPKCDEYWDKENLAFQKYYVESLKELRHEK